MPSALTLDYSPGYAAIINRFQDRQTTRQAALVAYDAAPTEANTIAISDLVPEMFQVGDETTALTAGAGKISFSFPFAVRIVGYVANLATASTVGAVTLDVNDGAATTITTKLTIDQDEKTSATAATPYVLSDTDLAANAVVTVDVDAEGTGAAGLKLWVYYRKA